MKTRNRLSGIALLLIVLLLAALLPMTTASAQADSTGWTVTNSGSTFIVTRTNTTASETVLYRTVSLSAIEGQHFVAASDTLTFAAGESSKIVVVSERTPSTDAYKYQTSSSRSYRFEVFGYDGTILAYKDRSVTNGLT